jgi:plasmid stabilization system protein ParE
MEYQVEVSDEAEAEMDAAYLFLSQRSPDAAFRWYTGARAAINSLSTFPRRCPLAREDASYPDNEVRQLLYGTGRSAYRILFMVFDDDAEVRVVQFRHGARLPRQQAQKDDD